MFLLHLIWTTAGVNITSYQTWPFQPFKQHVSQLAFFRQKLLVRIIKRSRMQWHNQYFLLEYNSILLGKIIKKGVNHSGGRLWDVLQ